MSKIKISHPYIQILARDTFALHADVSLPKHSETYLSVTLSCKELSLNATQDVKRGVKRPNSDELRFTFGVQSYRSHASTNGGGEKEFEVEGHVLEIDGTGGENIIARDTFPVKIRMT